MSDFSNLFLDSYEVSWENEGEWDLCIYIHRLNLIFYSPFPTGLAKRFGKMGLKV